MSIFLSPSTWNETIFGRERYEQRQGRRGRRRFAEGERRREGERKREGGRKREEGGRHPSSEASHIVYLPALKITSPPV